MTGAAPVPRAPSVPRPRALSLPDGTPMLAYGAQDARPLLLLQPLFEEANRCRALIATLCRTLATRGIGCWLPDWPGTGESPHALDDTRWPDWIAAVEAALRLSGARHVAAIRGGALLDADVPAGCERWRFVPVAGASLLTDLRRTALAGGDGSAGYPVPPGLHAALAAAEPRGSARTLRLEGDARPCDLRLPGPALWRRAEPAGNDTLAALLADDIAAWIAG
jgi:hypothetical protein